MKRLLTICILVLCCINIAKAQDALRYRLPNAIEHSVEQSYISNSIIELDSSVLIDGIIISGQIAYTPLFFIRLVVQICHLTCTALLREQSIWGDPLPAITLEVVLHIWATQDRDMLPLRQGCFALLSIL